MGSIFPLSCLVLPCLLRAPRWANAPRWGGRPRCWPAAPLPPPWVYLLGPVCRHPSSPVLLYASSVGQRGISAQTIQLLVPVALNYIDALRHLSPLSPVHCHCHCQLLDQWISGSVEEGAPTEEPTPDASNARSQRPTGTSGSKCLSSDSPGLLIAATMI
jgi:hypothetical protein